MSSSNKSKFCWFYKKYFCNSKLQSEQPIMQKVKLALKMVEKNLETSNILFNNSFRSKSDEFFDVKLLSEEKKKRKDTNDDEDEDEYGVKEYVADILLNPEFQTSPGSPNFLSTFKRMSNSLISIAAFRFIFHWASKYYFSNFFLSQQMMLKLWTFHLVCVWVEEWQFERFFIRELPLLRPKRLLRFALTALTKTFLNLTFKVKVQSFILTSN